MVNGGPGFQDDASIRSIFAYLRAWANALSWPPEEILIRPADGVVMRVW